MRTVYSTQKKHSNSLYRCLGDYQFARVSYSWSHVTNFSCNEPEIRSISDKRQQAGTFLSFIGELIEDEIAIKGKYFLINRYDTWYLNKFWLIEYQLRFIYLSRSNDCVVIRYGSYVFCRAEAKGSTLRVYPELMIETEAYALAREKRGDSCLCQSVIVFCKRWYVWQKFPSTGSWVRMRLLVRYKRIMNLHTAWTDTRWLRMLRGSLKNVSVIGKVCNGL